MASWAMSRIASLALTSPQQQGQRQAEEQLSPGLLDVTGPALSGDMLHVVLDTLASHSLKVGVRSCWSIELVVCACVSVCTCG
jgi:hypothetical protein